MSKRIYTESIKKWAIRAGIPVGTLIGITFLYLVYFGSIAITGHSGDMVCAGTIEDPCYAYVNFTANEDIFIYPTNYDPWGRDTPFEFDPNLKDWKLQRSWGNGWRDIPLDKSCTGTWCGLSNKDDTRKFSIAFRKGKDYQIRVVGYKNNPEDTIKWGFGYNTLIGELEEDYVDPIWFGTGNNTGLVAHWRLEGDAKDSVGNYDGTNRGGEVSKGVKGRGFHFSGENDIIFDGTETSIKFNETTNFTLSLWAKFDEFGESNSSGLLQKDYDYGMSFIHPSHRINFGYRNSTYSGDLYTSVNTLQENRWYLLTMTYESGGNMSLYIDDTLDSTDVPDTINIRDDNDFTIGGSRIIGGNRFLYANVSIDEVRIYNRSLSADEVSNLYNYDRTYSLKLNTDPAKGLIDESNLVYYYPFDSKDGSNNSKFIGYKNNGWGEVYGGDNPKHTNLGRFEDGYYFDGDDDYLELKGGRQVWGFEDLFSLGAPGGVLTTENIEGDYALNTTTGRNVYNQVFTWQGVDFDASDYVNSTNGLGDAYLTIWVKIDNCSRTVMPNGKCTIDAFEFGNENTVNQTNWDVDSIYDYNLTEGVWEKIQLNFNESNYQNIDTINWSEVDYVESYVANSSQEQTRVYFDDLRIHFPSSNKINYPFDFHNFSVSFWMNTDLDQINYSKYLNNHSTLFWRTDDSPNIFLKDSSGNIELFFKTQNFSGGDSSSSEIEYDIDDTLDGWHLVTVTYDTSTGNKTLYLDGEWKLSGANSNRNNNSNAGGLARLGEDDGDRNFEGILDDFRVYDIALTGDQVRNLYTGEKTNHISLRTDSSLDINTYERQTGFGISPRTAYSPYSLDDDNSHAYFDGNGDYVLVNNEFGINNTSEDFSVSLWFKLYDLGSLGYFTPLVYFKHDSLHGVGIQVDDGGDLEFIERNDSVIVRVESDVGDISEGVWYHAVAVNNGSDKNMSLFLNGVLENTDEGLLTDNFSSMKLAGEVVAGTLKHLNGSIDKVEIWNTSLTADDISTLYSDGRKSTTKRNETNLVSQYLFDDTSDANATDSAGLNDGTFEGDATYSYDVLGLELYLPFDDNVSTTTTYDYTDNNNDGTLVNDVIYNSSGKYGGAMSFDGDGDGVYLPDYYLSNESYSINVWVNPVNLSIANNVRYVIWRRDDFPSIRFSSTKINFMSDGNNGGAMEPLYNQDDYLNKWNMLTMTYNHTNGNITGYINGDYSSSSLEPITYTGMTDYGNQLGNFRIGTDGTANRAWNGSIDEVMVFSKALTPTEVNDLYTRERINHLLWYDIPG